MTRLSKILFTVAILLITQVCTAQVEKSLKTINGKEVMLHKVLPTETWTGIARTYNLSIEDVKSVNPGIDNLKEGQIINVPLMPSAASYKKTTPPSNKPQPTQTAQAKQVSPVTVGTKHTVKEKETLYGIAKKYGTTVDELKKLNGNIQTVKIGQIINVNSLQNKLNTGELAETKQPVVTKPATETKVETKATPILAKTEKIELIKQDKNDVTSVKPENKNYNTAEKSNTNITPIKIDASKKSQNENEVKTSSKSKNGSTVKEFTETGMAAWIKDGSLNQNKYYALHRSAPLGTIIKVNNRMNGEYVFVKVVGQLPETDENERQIIKISEAAAKKIGAINEHFQVELSYGVLN